MVLTHSLKIKESKNFLKAKKNPICISNIYLVYIGGLKNDEIIQTPSNYKSIIRHEPIFRLTTSFVYNRGVRTCINIT